ncbi:TPA: hypothetical protein MJB77_25765 [Klebsiella pneumoniae]|uniref:hypothetical protein n=1 Tax=Klebsiella pneumoniae TaxID=573 RepID=UPI000CEBD80D|nr:hypothetical protein [Klebsiella pneumoniae]HAY5094929.1 hypothetical protein [Escherichia coli]MCP6775016.1 hypothetical protein [Klebsiella pneumoniae]PPJ90447.1 hypothetical protein CSC93_00595 [Klebsiella pneumoniae]HBZ0630628.1 hypothetical protein [Klebsiella pneumoniae]HCI5233916.1 hypothetical protein [Klebsiella pneumoniae]
MEFKNAAAELVDTYQRQPGAELLEFARTDAYRQFVQAAEQEGFTGPEIEMDVDFAARSPEWVAQAGEQDLRRWVHTLIRCDRWNSEYPTAVMDACRSGCMSVLALKIEENKSHI